MNTEKGLGGHGKIKYRRCLLVTINLMGHVRSISAILRFWSSQFRIGMRVSEKPAKVVYLQRQRLGEDTILIKDLPRQFERYD